MQPGSLSGNYSSIVVFRMLKKVVYKIKGLDCPACAINIDGSLEETPGIKKAETNYASSQTNIEFDPEKIGEKEIKQIIKKTGYSVSL